MSAEQNKILCAILTAILILLLSSFISELLYHPKSKGNKVSYLNESSEVEIIQEVDTTVEKNNDITEEYIEKLLVNASLEDGDKFVNKNCKACHDFSLPIKNKIGPSLAKIKNRKIAAVKDYKYSNALKSIDDSWSNKNLYLFLEKPKTWAEGTKMSYRGINSQSDLINVLKYLSHITRLNES